MRQTITFDIEKGSFKVGRTSKPAPRFLGINAGDTVFPKKEVIEKNPDILRKFGGYVRVVERTRWLYSEDRKLFRPNVMIKGDISPREVSYLKICTQEEVDSMLHEMRSFLGSAAFDI